MGNVLHCCVPPEWRAFSLATATQKQCIGTIEQFVIILMHYVIYLCNVLWHSSVLKLFINHSPVIFPRPNWDGREFWNLLFVLLCPSPSFSIYYLCFLYKAWKILFVSGDTSPNNLVGWQYICFADIFNDKTPKFPSFCFIFYWFVINGFCQV